MKLLLHICCAPCSIMCIETLRQEGIEPVGFWDNPNIHPYTEYRSRKNCLTVADDIDGRCVQCYRMRMEPTARYAAENGFSHICTTLFVSPYQNHELLRQVAEEEAARYGVELLYRDFRPWFRQGQDKARELGLYMQKYCGCVFSEEDRYRKRKKKAEPKPEEGKL